MKMIYLAICFLQLVCSKHFLIETEDTIEDTIEDTNEASIETKQLGLNYPEFGMTQEDTEIMRK